MSSIAPSRDQKRREDTTAPNAAPPTFSEAKYTEVTRTSSSSYKPPMSKDAISNKKAQTPQSDSGLFSAFSYIKHMITGKPTSDTSAAKTPAKSVTVKKTSAVKEKKQSPIDSKNTSVPVDIKHSIESRDLLTFNSRQNVSTTVVAGNKTAADQVADKFQKPRSTTDIRDDDVPKSDLPNYTPLRFIDNKSTYLHTPDRKGTASFRITTAPKTNHSPNMPTLLSPVNGKRNPVQKQPAKPKSKTLSRKRSQSPRGVAYDSFQNRLRSRSTPDSPVKRQQRVSLTDIRCTSEDRSQSSTDDKQTVAIVQTSPKPSIHRKPTVVTSIKPASKQIGKKPIIEEISKREKTSKLTISKAVKLPMKHPERATGKTSIRPASTASLTVQKSFIRSSPRQHSKSKSVTLLRTPTCNSVLGREEAMGPTILHPTAARVPPRTFKISSGKQDDSNKKGRRGKIIESMKKFKDSWPSPTPRRDSDIATALLPVQFGHTSKSLQSSLNLKSTLPLAELQANDVTNKPAIEPLIMNNTEVSQQDTKQSESCCEEDTFSHYTETHKGIPDDVDQCQTQSELSRMTIVSIPTLAPQGETDSSTYTCPSDIHQEGNTCSSALSDSSDMQTNMIPTCLLADNSENTVYQMSNGPSLVIGKPMPEMIEITLELEVKDAHLPLMDTSNPLQSFEGMQPVEEAANSKQVPKATKVSWPKPLRNVGESKDIMKTIGQRKGNTVKSSNSATILKAKKKEDTEVKVVTTIPYKKPPSLASEKKRKVKEAKSRRTSPSPYLRSSDGISSPKPFLGFLSTERLSVQTQPTVLEPTFMNKRQGNIYKPSSSLQPLKRKKPLFKRAQSTSPSGLANPDYIGSKGPKDKEKITLAASLQSAFSALTAQFRPETPESAKTAESDMGPTKIIEKPLSATMTFISSLLPESSPNIFRKQSKDDKREEKEISPTLTSSPEVIPKKDNENAAKTAKTDKIRLSSPTLSDLPKLFDKIFKVEPKNQVDRSPAVKATDVTVPKTTQEQTATASESPRWFESPFLPRLKEESQSILSEGFNDAPKHVTAIRPHGKIQSSPTKYDSPTSRFPSPTILDENQDKQIPSKPLYDLLATMLPPKSKPFSSEPVAKEKVKKSSWKRKESILEKLESPKRPMRAPTFSSDPCEHASSVTRCGETP